MAASSKNNSINTTPKSTPTPTEITKVDVKVLPVNDYSAHITVTADGDKSTVEWKGAFYRGYMLNDPPPELSDEVALKAVTGLYRDGLAALKKKIEGGS